MSIAVIENAKDFAEFIAETEKQCFSQPWSPEAVKAFLSYDYNNAAVALIDGIPAGYITYGIICGELQISNVATAPLYRRRGVGDALVEKIISIADSLSCETVTLEVRFQNTPARKLYEKHGFLTVGIRKGYYKNPKDDAVLMNYEPCCSK